MALEQIVGYDGMYVKPSLEEMVNRLLVVVAWLATRMSEVANDPRGAFVPPLRTSAEYAIEVILYPEHFPPGTLEALNVTFAGAHRIQITKVFNKE